MSAQSGKKRRLGSRRHGVNQSETSQPDELKDSTSVAQPNIPEENAESLNVLSNPDYSQLETKHPPSPELTGHKRKLGSSRRNKGRQHVKDPVAEQNDKPREEMEKNTSDDTLETTQMSIAIQPEKQTALCQGNEQDVTHNTHSSEGQNPSISEVDVENVIPENENLQANYSQREIDSKLVSDSWKLVEITLGRTDKSDTHECAEVSNQVEENARCVGITDVNSSSLHLSPTVDQQPTDESNTEEMTGEELHSVYSATHSENKEGDGDAELLRQDGNLQSNCLVSYSYEKSEDMEFSTTAEITTEKSSQKETFSSPDRKLAPNKEHSEHFNLSEVKDAQYSDDSVNKEDKQKVRDAQHLEEAIYEGHEREVTATQMQEMQQSGYSSESVIHDVKEKMDTSSENLMDRAEIRDIYQSEVSADESATKQEVSNPDDKQDEPPIKESNIGALDQRDEDDHVEEQTDTGFNPIGNRRKLGSSRRNKGRRHIKDPVAESYHEATEEMIENEPETTVEEKSVETMLEEMDKLDTSQTEEVSDQIKEDAHVSTLVSISEFTGSSLHPSSTVDQQITDQSNSTEMPNEELPDVYSITDTENKEENEDKELCQHGNLQGNYLVSESDIKSEDMEFSTTPGVTSDKTSTMENIESEYIDEQATFSSPTEELSTSEEQNEHFNSSEVKDAQHSQDSVNKENKQDVTATQMQEMQQSAYSSESAIHDVKEKMDTSSENLIDRAEIRDTYQSEVSADESATKQEVSNPDDKQNEHPIKESNIVALDQIDEDDHVSDTKEPWISNIAPRQVYEDEDQEEEDIKLSAEETVHQVKEEMLSEVKECESSSQTQQGEINAPLDSQPQHESVNIEEQTDTGFNPIGNRRKLGSSRRSKGRRHIKDPVAESYHEATEEMIENEPETTVEEKSVETMLEEMDKLDTSQTEEVSDQVKEDAHVSTLVSISEFTGSSLHPSSTVDQQITDRSNSTEMPNEELPDVYSITDTENKEENGDQELCQHGNLQGNYLVSESDIKSEDMEFLTTSEVTSDKTSTMENIESEYIDEQATFSSPTEELSTSEEQNEHFNSSEVKDAQYSQDYVNKENKQEVTATQMQEMQQSGYSSESVIHDVKEKMDTSSENLIDRAEIRDIYQSEVSADESATKQEVSNPDEKQDEPPIKESNIGALDQRDEDDHVSNTKEPWISNIAPRQVYEGEDQEEEDIKPSAEETVHQVKEEMLSEVEECESSSQTQQGEINAPLNSQPQHESVNIEEQTDTGFNPIGNRRKLGSSRRNKGRRHIKDPVAESYHEATEEMIENEPETTVEEKSVETMLEEMDKLDTSQTEEVSDQIKEDAHVSTLVSISEFTDSSLHPSSTVDQQITDQSNSSEMPNEELPDVYSITDTENKEENEDKELCQHGNLQGNYLVSESDIKSEDMEFLTTPEVTSDKTSTMENIESEYIDEQATFSSPTEELSTSEEQNEHFNSSEVKDAQHSHDSVNKENKQEVTATQMQEMQQSAYSSESVIHDVKEKMDTSSENLIDRAEIRDIYQSEVSADESATKQEVSNPEDKQDEHPNKESNIGVFDQIDEDDHISNTKEPWISNIAPRQVYDGEDQEEEDIKPSAEETVHQVKEEMLSEVEECESSSQTQQGEINAPLNSQPQHESVNIEEQTDTGFNPIGNRRKLGSSRRSKGRRHIKDPVAESYHEATEDIIENEPETTVEEKSVETMLEEMDKLDTSKTEEVSDQIKEDAHDMPNEDRANTENKERDEGTELLGQHGNLYSKYLVSESNVSTTEITTEKSSLGKSSVEKEAFSSLDGKLSTNKEQSEHFILVEVRGAQQSEEAVNKLHEQEVKPTQIHKMDQIDHSSVREEDKSSIHTLQSGMQSLLVSQPQDDSVSIQAQTHTGHTVSRRKMGSSRRHKERQLVKDSDSDMEPKEVIVNSRCGEMSSATETTPQEELTDRGLKQDEKRQVCSTVKEKSNTEKMQEEDTVLSENVLDNNAIVTTDITSSSDKDDSVKSNKEVSEKEKKQTEKPLVKIDSPKVSVWKEDSDIQSISYQGNNVSTGSSTLDVLKQEEAFQVQNLEAISSDEKLLTNNMMETSTENSGISNADDAHTSQQETQENSDDSENVQIKSKQKKRKMGSTRRTLNRKQEGGIDNKDETEESNLNAESDISNLNKVEQEAEVPSIVTTDVSQNENGKLSQSTMQQKPQVIKEVSTVQEQERAVYSSTDSNMITGIDDLMAFLPEQPSSFTEEVVNAVKCFQVRDVTNTETFCGTTESDEDVNEGPHNANFEMKNASPNLNLTNRKRRMGSSRRNLGTISKREDQKQVVDNEATETNVKDVMTEHGIKEKELQLQKEHNDGDSEPVKEKVFETVERSRTGDSYAKPPGHQKAEENPVSNQQVDTEHHLTPDVIPVKPATSPKYDAMSESPHAGRRRKMGSHRKSHGHQTSRKDKIIDIETGRTITGESGMKTLEEHREESLGLDKKSEVIESDKKTSSNISITKTGEHSRPVSEKTPVRLGQESQKHLSLADNSNSYNVVMVGDSSVGKTSFMKRARSGKFSFDLPASVGLDSCLWTVLVEGKPVVLQLWDTAGQERFHSITRQIFHKAHAFLLMYDITSSQSFSAVRYWVNCIKDGAMEDVTILLLGNKSDCAERQVPTQQGEILAKEYNFDFMECSAATGENVVQSLEVVARLLSQKVNTGKEAVVLHKEPKQKTTSGCC